MVSWYVGKVSWVEVRCWICECKLVFIEMVWLIEYCGFVEVIEVGV